MPTNEPKITPELVASHGLKPDEYERILKLIGREPTFTELGIFSAMWNEHCSYKSSKKWLRTLPTTGERVIQGPGENAGVVDIGDGQAILFVHALGQAEVDELGHLVIERVDGEEGTEDREPQREPRRNMPPAGLRSLPAPARVPRPPALRFRRTRRTPAATASWCCRSRIGR